MQGALVSPLVREDLTCRGATNSVCHNSSACALEPASRTYWARALQLLKPMCPRAHASQQEKPPQNKLPEEFPAENAVTWVLHTVDKLSSGKEGDSLDHPAR